MQPQIQHNILIFVISNLRSWIFLNGQNSETYNYVRLTLTYIIYPSTSKVYHKTPIIVLHITQFALIWYVTSFMISSLLCIIYSKYLKLSVYETPSSLIQTTSFVWFFSLKLAQKYSVLEWFKQNPFSFKEHAIILSLYQPDP